MLLAIYMPNNGFSQVRITLIRGLNRVIDIDIQVSIIRKKKTNRGANFFNNVIKEAKSVTLNIFRKKKFFLNHL